MKTIISENKLHDVISKYLDDYLEGNKINWTYGLNFDESEYEDGWGFDITSDLIRIEWVRYTH